MPKEMTLTRKTPDRLVGGIWYYKTEIRSVRVMATAEGYAMVRFKGAAPFVCREKELSTIK